MTQNVFQDTGIKLCLSKSETEAKKNTKHSIDKLSWLNIMDQFTLISLENKNLNLIKLVFIHRNFT